MSPYQPYPKVINNHHSDPPPPTRSPRNSGSRPIAHYSLMPPSIPPHHTATRISSAPVGPPRLVRLPPPTPPPSQPLPRPQPLKSHPLAANTKPKTPPSSAPPSSTISSSPGLSPAETSTTTTTTTRPSLTPEQVDSAAQAVLALQTDATTLHSKAPSAAILLGPDKRTTLLSHLTISHVRHAESELARLAVDHFSTSYLSGCTLVSTWEPCAMCAGTIYWSGIGTVVYVASQAKLKEAAAGGRDSDSDSDSELLLLPGLGGLPLPCRTVFRAGQRQVDVIGPVAEWEGRVVDESAKWWKQQHDTVPKPKGSKKSVTKTSATGNDVVIWTGEDSVLSSIGEDGEYRAELNIDWMR